MKKLSVGVVAVATAFLLGTVAYGAWQGDQQVDVNALRQFQKETLPLRDELQAKSLDLQNEYAKENPDQAKIASLRGEIADLRAKIQTAAEKQGVPDWCYGAGMRGGYGSGYAMRGPRGWGGQGDGYACRGWGRGRMMGDGYGGRGWGRGYCPMW